MNLPLEFHPLADLFPLIEGDDFTRLVADVKARGLLFPITTLGELILDGRNRYRACIEAGVEARSEPYGGDDPVGFVVASNLHRRHLDESQRAMVAAKLATMRQGARTDLAPIGATSQVDAGDLLNVSRRAVQRATVVRERGTPELVKAVDQGKIAVSIAAKLADLPIAEQKKAVADPAGAHHLAKQQIRKRRESDLADKIAALPQAKFGVILADPEWKFEFWSEKGKTNSAAENHYPTSALDEIKARDVPSICAEDCVLFLWATVPMLPQALDVMATWGFQYVSNFVWVKDRIGTGYWNRNKHEILLIGTRGKVPAPAPGSQWDSAIAAAVGKHSAKPAVFYELIEAYFPNLPKIELNARGPARPGWQTWGLEAAEAAE